MSGHPAADVDTALANLRALLDHLPTQATVRANGGINGKEYPKFGTTFGNRIIVIDHGKVIANDTLAGLTNGGGTLESVFLTLTGRSLRD